MADRKITDLPEYTGVVAMDDWVEMVDKSNTADDAAGSSFKVRTARVAVVTNANGIIATRIFGR